MSTLKLSWPIPRDESMAELESLLTYGLLSKEKLLGLSKTAGFTQPQVVELFRWDLELVSQIQRQSGDFILKGGAAAQLYIPLEKQRGSALLRQSRGLRTAPGFWFDGDSALLLFLSFRSLHVSTSAGRI